MTKNSDWRARLQDHKAAFKGDEPAEVYNARMDPFMEVAQAIHDEAYANGFADAKYQGVEAAYDREALIEDLDPDMRRDSFYEGLEHDARTKFEAALASSKAAAHD